MSSHDQLLIAVVVAGGLGGYAIVSAAFHLFGKRGPEPDLTEAQAREILGVSWHASAEQIESAYHLLLDKYRPDRIAHLDSEFRKFAAEQTRQVTAAYQRLRKG
jgi:DnaJ-domain-containing protein 1